ncbi:unnamed protein product, partial [Iphiclides podalirius]
MRPYTAVCRIRVATPRRMSAASIPYFGASSQGMAVVPTFRKPANGWNNKTHGAECGTSAASVVMSAKETSQCRSDPACRAKSPLGRWRRGHSGRGRGSLLLLRHQADYLSRTITHTSWTEHGQVGNWSRVASRHGARGAFRGGCLRIL